MPATLDAQLSLDLLIRAQSANGALPASTVHEVYQFGWLRDGSWCAYALDRGGRSDAAARWHRWVADTLLRHEYRVDEALNAVAAGIVDGRVMMPARFTLAGEEEPVDPAEEWPNFQTDCYGFWLWAAADHVRRGGGLDPTVARAMRLVVRYLLGAGETPCYDCWEEYPGLLHTSSLAAVSAGLRDAGELLGDAAASGYAETIRQRLLGPEFTLAGGFVRSAGGDTRVDGSLLWIGVPFGLVPLDSDVFRTTVKRIREELRAPGGGVRRYLGDSFYGGSQWILLAASLGRVALAEGRVDEARELLAWMESAATSEGFLPEQVADDVYSPHMLAFWREPGGPHGHLHAASTMRSSPSASLITMPTTTAAEWGGAATDIVDIRPHPSRYRQYLSFCEAQGRLVSGTAKISRWPGASVTDQTSPWLYQ